MIKACIYACSMEKPEKSIKYKNEFNPVQIRSAPLKKPGKSRFFGFFFYFVTLKKIRWQIF